MYWINRKNPSIMPCSGSRKNWRNFWKKKTLTVQKVCDIIYRLISHQTFAAMAQSVERRLGKAEVTGSSPVSSLKASQSLGRFFYGHQSMSCKNGYFCVVFIKIHEKKFVFLGRLSVFHRNIFFVEMGLLSSLDVLV